MMKSFCLRVGMLLAFVLFALTAIQADDTLGKAESDLISGIQGNDEAKIEKSVRQLAGINSEKSAQAVIAQLNRVSADDSKAYWAILKGLHLFTSDEALDVIASFIISNKTKPVGRDTLYIMKDNQSPGMIKLLSRVLEKGGRSQQILALDYLSGIKSKLAISVLIEFLNNPDCLKEEDLKEKTITSINALFGKPIGQTPEEIIKWWSKHQNDNEKDLFAPPEKPAQNAIVTDTAADDYFQIDVLRRVKPEQIVVVLADCKRCEAIGKSAQDWDHNFDHIEFALDQMKIPHIVVKKSDFDKEDFKLNDRIAIIFNCNYIRKHCVCPTCKWSDQRGGLRSGVCAPGCNNHILHINMLSDKAIAKIKEFVSNGGYLFSEDWILEEVLERAFKGIVSHSKYYLKPKDVTVLPAPGATTHPYLKGVFEKRVAKAAPADKQDSDNNPPADDGGTVAVKRLKVGEAKWRVDKDSPDIKIDKPQEVTVLMISPGLKATDRDSGAVAITFGFGGKPAGPNAVVSGESDSNGGYISAKRKTGGQVLHVLSHFGKQHQPTDGADEFVLQNLMLNFLTEAAERYNYRPKK